MATLTEEQKLFAVNLFASFETPQQVSDALKEEYGVDVPRSQLVAYDPTRFGKNTGRAGKKWVEIFWSRRKTFLAEVDAIPIANMAFRLQKLSTLLTHAIARKNAPLAASLMEQAAKEVGGMYKNTRKHELTGADGAPLQTGPTIVELVAPTIVSSDESAG